jgi:hypothetical protein
MRKNKKGKGRYIAVAVVVIVAVIIVWLLYMGTGAHPAAQQSFGNINLTEVESVIGSGMAYRSLEVNNITSFASSPGIGSSGYRYVSVSEFNATPPHTSVYPVLITSVLYVMANSSAANQIEQSVLYTANQSTPRTSGRLYNYTTVTSYAYNGAQTYIYGIASVAVLNSSYIPAVNQYPIYEYTSAFSYGNYAGFVSTSGYENMSSAYSTSMVELLFRKMVGPALAH